MATGSDEGALRLACAALHANGGFAVGLLLPGRAASGNDAEQLGLSTPQFEETPLGPAVWRKSGKNAVLLVAGKSVAALVGSQQLASAEAMFEAAVGVVVDGVQYAITGCEPLLVAGVACAYRVTCEAPTWA